MIFLNFTFIRGGHFLISRLGRRKSPATTFFQSSDYRQLARVSLISQVTSLNLTYGQILWSEFFKAPPPPKKKMSLCQNFEVGLPVFQKRLSMQVQSPIFNSLLRQIQQLVQRFKSNICESVTLYIGMINGDINREKVPLLGDTLATVVARRSRVE